MPSINNQPVLPGVFTQVQQQLLPSVTGGIRVAAYIGTGRLTNLVTGEAVTRGSGNDDALSHTAVALDGTTITDQNFATYESGVDYSSTPVSGGMAWLTGVTSLTGTTHDPYASLSGLNFQLRIANGAIQTIPFTTETTAAQVAATLNSSMTGAVASTTPSTHATGIVTVVDYTKLSLASAKGTATVVDYTMLAGAVLTIHGHALTEGVEWTAATSNSATATSLASAITTATATTLSTGSALGAVVTITANTAGAVGNTITLTTSDAVHLPVSGATLTGGQNNAILTVNGISLTQGTQWTAATNNNATATSLANAITTATATTLSTGSAVGNVITVTANAAGPSGDNITLTTSNSTYLPVSGVSSSNPYLATSATYAVLGDTAVTNTGNTVLTGDLGVSPGSSITGFPPGTFSGSLHQGDAAAAQAHTDATSAATTLQATGPGTDITSTDLGGFVATPGTYSAAAAGTWSAGNLTLNGAGTYIFLFGTSLTMPAAASVILENGATANNVYFVTGTTFTFGANDTVNGTILAGTSITFAASSVLNGRALVYGPSGTTVTFPSAGTVTVPASSTLSGGDNSLVITTTASFNSSISIENGTANSILGFVAGSLVSTPQRPALGVVYFVNYEWAKAVGDGQNSFEPQFFFLQNFSSVTNAVGTVGGGDSQTANMGGAWTLPIAAQLAQENGASIVCLMQMNPVDGANASQVRAALTKLLIPNINIVVSLDAADNAMLIPDITNHVITASSTINRLERTAFIGFSRLSNPSDTTMLGYATAASSNRVVVVNQTNTTYSMFIGTNTTASTVDGTMMASALAALRTNPAFDVAQPLTREVVSGIATTNTLAQSEKVILSNNGVLIVDNISGSPKVVFGTTTAFDTILNQLYQVTEIADYCTQTIRGLLDPIFIGQKLLANTPSQVETVTSAILSDIESSNIIESFTQPIATVNPLQPTQILVNVGVQPVLELDTILITLGLNLA